MSKAQQHMPEKTEGNRGFLIMGILTIASVYILILVGGIVRSTGSGMGCPDWPKCFGDFVPPTSASELPENYKEIYADKRLKKNQKVAAILHKLGFEETAVKILNDPSIYQEADFNPVKTWIEYINRIIGVLVGFFIFLLVCFSYTYLKSDSTIFWLSFLSLLLVGFEGWLGSIVVSTNLLPFTITLHMGLALVIVILLIYILFRAEVLKIPKVSVKNDRVLKGLLYVLLGGTFLQVLIGTQVREAIDLIALSMNNENRDMWVSGLGVSFSIHRLVAYVILVVHIVYMFFLLKNVGFYEGFSKVSICLFLLVLIAMGSGIFLYYSFSPFIQPVHLLIACLLIGIQFFLILTLNKSSSKQTIS